MKNSSEKYNLFLGEFFYKAVDIPTRENLSNLFLSEFSKEDRDERVQKVIIEGKNGFIKNENSFFDITQTFLDKTLGSRFDILSEIKNTLDSKKISDYSILDELINTENIKCIFSINYDIAIEKSKKYYDELESILPFKVTKDLKSPEFEENNKIHYYKLLGDISNLNDMCITSQDIRRMKMLPFYSEFWNKIIDEILDRPTIFLGMNFNDHDFLDIIDFLFSKIKRLGQPIYLVQESPLFNESVIKLKDKYGMKIICSNEYDFLKNFNLSDTSADFLKKKVEILVPHDENTFIVKNRRDSLQSNIDSTNKSQQKKKKGRSENKVIDENTLSADSSQNIKEEYNKNENIIKTKVEILPEGPQEDISSTVEDIINASEGDPETVESETVSVEPIRDSQINETTVQMNIIDENLNEGNATITENLIISDDIVENSIINSVNEDNEINTDIIAKDTADYINNDDINTEDADINRTINFITIDNSQLEKEISNKVTVSEEVIERIVNKKEINFILCEDVEQEMPPQALINTSDDDIEKNIVETQDDPQKTVIPTNINNSLSENSENTTEHLKIDSPSSKDDFNLIAKTVIDENVHNQKLEEDVKNTSEDFTIIFSNNIINDNFDNFENNVINPDNLPIAEESINYDLISDELIVENNFISPEKIGYNAKSEFFLADENDKSSNEIERLTEDDVIGIDNPTYDDLIAIVSKKQTKVEAEEATPIIEKKQDNEIIFQKIVTDNIANQPLIDDSVNIEISLDDETKNEVLINDTEIPEIIDEIDIQKIVDDSDENLIAAFHEDNSPKEEIRPVYELKGNEKIINIEQFKRERFLEKENKESIPHNEILKERIEDTRLPQVHILSGDTNEIEVELYRKYLSLELDYFPIKGSHLLDDVIDDYVSIENLGSSDVMIGDTTLHSARIRMFIRKNTNVIEIKTKEFSLSFGVYDDGSRLLIRSSDIYKYQIFSDLKNSRLTWVATTLKNFFSGSPVIFNSKGYAGTIEYRNEQEVRKFNILLNSIKDYETIVGVLKLNKEKNISEMENSFYTLFLLSSYLHGNRELINFINFSIPNKNNIKSGDYISFERIHKLKFRGITFDLKEVITLKEAITLGEANPNTVNCNYKKVGITLAKLDKVQEMLKS
ncbi:SIR2 family protein [Fusobacterium sp. PH5-44]|uniref:SIR2 family protein n=1 Tax=unclassified Fusobacterium TaxID=2648384 RepID=UPI003D1B880C